MGKNQHNNYGGYFERKGPMKESETQGVNPNTVIVDEMATTNGAQITSEKFDENGMPYKNYQEDYKPYNSKRAVVISRGKLNVRPLPVKNGDPKCQVDPGDFLSIVEKAVDGWTYVVTSFGVEGYVMNEFIKEV